MDFARDDPAAGGGPVLRVDVVALTEDDLDPVAALAAEREGTPVGRWHESFRRALGDEDQIVLAARRPGSVVGYGRAAWLDPAASGGRGMPTGWYLTGVVVGPSHRRRGVARTLTLARLDALVGRGAQEVWCFAAAVNTPSIRLHETLGFAETSRDIHWPGVTFTGGVGVLMRWAAPR